MHSFNENGELLPEEVDTINLLTKIPIESLNLDAIAVVTNIYRIAQGLRTKMEREVLSAYGLSWTSFSILYDLWIWNSLETKKLALSAGITKATVSNITNTLERKELCFRKVDNRDRRITFVTITEKGKRVMEELYPQFHENEVDIVLSLSVSEQKGISKLLRRVIRENNF
ncbi:MarR family transcriptional regulator [Cytobacillus solani]|uniref:MarR family transcriptional regulator n=1 Tax=Cytobacillus solani TaxID=1637975 RepID=A0A0Q3QV31_9BACI|nr:MarR family transcriptional regulator [Cytobacillus solani]KOP83929.1 MarR family transcriptional regulator [Bacillus sp. FJAT-21945]KQL21865.1 MarR family transcriptional regulator [Cytobacillus solani]USK57523.1 MarR family transcriptional regulator [Cytobacillus solani]